MVAGIKKFLSWPCKLRILFLEAFVIQTITWMLLKLLPFRVIFKLYHNPEKPMKEFRKDIPEKIKIVTSSAISITCLRNRCLVQSLTARCMLRRRRIESQLSFGFMKDRAGNSVAHAWIVAGDIEIVEKGNSYVELKRF